MPLSLQLHCLTIADLNQGMTPIVECDTNQSIRGNNEIKRLTRSLEAPGFLTRRAIQRKDMSIATAGKDGSIRGDCGRCKESQRRAARRELPDLGAIVRIECGDGLGAIVKWICRNYQQAIGR